MAEPTERTKTTETSLSTDFINLARHYLGGRRGFIVLAVTVLGAGAVFNWGWLVAVGIAPLLVALAPCALMCGLGLCMRGMGGKSCSSDSKSCSSDSQDAKTSMPEVQSEMPRDDNQLAESRDLTSNTTGPDQSVVVELSKDKRPSSE